MVDIKAFLFENGEKAETLKAYIYSFYYRYVVKHTPSKKLEGRLGLRGKESPEDVSIDKLRKAKLYAFHVNRITERLPWDEKCLVRALTLRKLLLEKHISSTIYLGLRRENDTLKAHAWLRCGNLYLSGGDGEGHTVVAKFANL